MSHSATTALKKPGSRIAAVSWFIFMAAATGAAAEQRPAVECEERTWDLSYASFRPGSSDIYLFDTIDSPPQQLTTDAELDYDPAISADGRWVVFTSERLGSADLFVIDLHGDRLPRPLVTGRSHEDQADISEDGKWLTFVSSRDGQADIYVAPFLPDQTLQVAAAQRVTTSPSGDFRPSFSPDGHWIAFSSDRDHEASNANPVGRTRGTEIYVVAREGEQPRRLTYDGRWSGAPKWSKDGSSIFFYSSPIYSGPNLPSDTAVRAVPVRGGSTTLLAEGMPLALTQAVGPDGGLYILSGAPPQQRRAAESKLMRVVENGTVVEIHKPAMPFRDLDFARDGTVVAHAAGRLPGGAAGGAAALLGPGPMLAARSPLERKLGAATLRLHPVREAIVMADQGRPGAVLRNLLNPTRIISSTISGDDVQLIAEPSIRGFPVSPASASPDGAWIVFMTGQIFGSPETEADLMRVSRGGSEQTNLTAASPANDGFPVVSPDGAFIYFRSGREGNYDIFRMRPDGSEVTNLTRHPARDTFPAISPDGRLLAFASDRDQTEARLFDIYVGEVGADGTLSSVRRITENRVQEGHPVFSPDGQWVLFASELGGALDEALQSASSLFSPQPYGEIYAFHLSSGHAVRLTEDRWEDGTPAFIQPK